MFLPQYYKFVFIDLSSNHPYPTSFHNRSIFHIPAHCGREGLDSAGVAARGHVNGRGPERSEGRDLPVGAKPLPAAKGLVYSKKLLLNIRLLKAEVALAVKNLEVKGDQKGGHTESSEDDERNRVVVRDELGAGALAAMTAGLSALTLVRTLPISLGTKQRPMF